MAFASGLRHLKSRFASTKAWGAGFRPPRKAIPIVRPRLEQLEDRTMLSNSNIPAIFLLDPSSRGALNVTGNGSIAVSGGGSVIIDSADPLAAVATGNANIIASEFDITGNPGFVTTGSGNFQGVIHSGIAPLADSLAMLPVPQVPTTTFAAVNYSGKTPLTLSPGTYVGGINISGHGSVMLLPGIYYLQGGGFSISGQGSVSGDGVMLYSDGGGPISFTGNGSVHLTPPTSGTYQNITIFQDRASSAPINLTGNAGINISGTIYAPGATLNLAGNGGLTAPGVPSAINEYVLSDLNDTGNGSVQADASFNQAISLTVGLSPAPRHFPDGSLVTNVSTPTLQGTTRPGAIVDLETGNDGLFDEGHTTADVSGSFSFPVTLTEGGNLLQVRATSRFDQQVTASIQITLDTVLPTATISPSGTLNTTFSSFDVFFSKAMDAPGFSAGSYTLQVRGGPNDGQAITIQSVTQLTPSTAQINLATPLPNQGYRFTIGTAVTDFAGNMVANPQTFDFIVAQPVKITEMSPANGEDMVSVARAVVVRFDKPIDPSTVTTASFYLIADGQHLRGTVRVSSTNQFATFFPANPLPPSTEVRVVVDGSQIKDPQGLLIDGAGNSSPGSQGTADFRTLPLTRIAGTDVFGYVYDSYNKNPDGSNIPVVGATIRVDAFPQANTVTDANGYFLLRDMPAPSFFVHVDGSTASNAPAGTMYPSVGKEFMSVPGQTTQLTMNGSTFNVYLPPMATGDIQALSATQSTDVGFGAGGMTELHNMFPTIDPAVWQRLKVTFPANSAQDNAGNAATQAAVIPVPPDRLPAPLPPGQNPKLVISIQAMGATRFDVPAPLTYPNIDGLAPGTKALVWSFNHEAGRWDVIGTATVSADGLTLVTDPGVGIKAPGWHFVQVGTGADGHPCTDQQCVVIPGDIGDVIKIDLNPAVPGGATAKDWQITKSPDPNTEGQFATVVPGSTDLIGSDDPASATTFSQTGVLFFVPAIRRPSTSESDLGAPFVATATFTATLVDSAGKETHPTGKLEIKVASGFATPVTLDTNDRLNVYRKQQRLRFLGYQDMPGNSSNLLTVTGTLDSPTEHATGVFNAAVTAHFNQIVDENSTTIMSFINAKNAPRWVEVAFGGAVQDAENFPEHWMTHWAKAVLDNAVPPIPTVFRFTGASQKGGGISIGPTGKRLHTFHQAGMDIDIATPSSNDGSRPFYATRTVAGDPNTYIAAKTPDDPNGLSHIVYFDPLNFYHAGPIDGDRTNALVHSYAVYNSRLVLAGIRDLIVDNSSIGYNLDTVQRQIDAFRGSLVSSVFYNDPRTWTNPDGSIGFVRYQSGHGGHFHLNIDPPSPNFDPPPLDPTPSMSTSSGFGSDPRLYYRFVLANGFEIAGRSDMTGEIATVLPPDTDYTLSLYQASTNRSGIYEGHSNQSGFPTDLPPFVLDQFGGVDNTGDGLPDIARYVIGLKVGVRSFAGDGIDDALKIAMGLDPFEGRAFPTGLISSLPLQGTAQKVLPEGNKLYVATGSYGLAIVDGTQFNNPIVLGQLSLGGYATDIGVDANLQIAAVATGSALQLVDVSDPMAPKLGKSVALSATRVVVANGLAYAVAGNSLDEIDLLTGEVLQSLSLPGFGNVTGLARDGTTLYAYDRGSGTFMDIDISSEAQATVLGQLSVSIASSDVGVFVGNGVAWLAGSGLHTVDVSDPTHPALIHGADVTFTARRIALNGSGLGVLAPDGNSFVEVYDTSNPNVTANRLLQIPLSGGARNVAISRGIAYVADGAGLEVVNYLPFDNKGVAPQITISTSVPSVDINSLKVLEGTTVPVRADASDDVQVRDVELLVNGQMVRDAVSFPFDFFAIAPTIAQSGSSFTIQAQATDTGGNTMLSNVITIGLVKDTSPPTISSIDPANGTSRVEGAQTVRVRFSKSLAAATVTTTNFQLQDAAGNPIAPANFQLRDYDRVVELTYSGLAAGDYQFVVNGSGITDRAGNPLGTTVTSSFTLTPRATVTVTNAPGLQVFEGTTLHGTITVAVGVSVQTVALVADGQVVRTSSSAPFNFSTIAPVLSSGATTVTLQARVTDTSGFVTTTPPVVITLLKDTTPPTIVSTSPANGGTAFQGLTTIQINFSKSLAPATVQAANFQVIGAGPDGVFGDADDVVIPITSFQLQNDSMQVVLTSASLAVGTYQLQVNEAGITDRPGNLLGSGTFLSVFTVVPSQVIESFESGNLSLYTFVSGSRNASVTAAAAHDGSFGLSAADFTDWMYRNDAAVQVRRGDVISVWMRSSGTPSGRGYFGFGATASGTLSIVMAPNTNTLIIQRNAGYGFQDIGAVTQTWLADHWYRFEVTWQASGNLIGRLYDSDGTTLLNTVTASDTTVSSGGIAFRSFSSTKYFDTVVLTGGIGQGGQPQFFAGNPNAPTWNMASLTQEQLRPVVAHAIAELATAGYNVSGLSQIDYHIANLPSSLLGLTYQRTIWIDQNAQGYGWYIDVSASSTAAFTQVTGANELQAAPGSPAYGHVDLLTVVTHELGHVLGFASIDPGILGHDWMTATLETGVRRYPDAALGSEPGLPAQLRAEHFPVDMAGPQSASEKQPNSGLAPVASSNPVPMGTVFDNPAPNYVFLDVDSYQSYRLNVMRGMDQALLGTLGQTILSGSAGRGSHIVRLGKRPDLEESIINWIAPDGLATGHANGALSPTIWDDDFGVALLFDHAIDSHDHGLVFMAAR
jgi:hypothetical protein